MGTKAATRGAFVVTRPGPNVMPLVASKLPVKSSLCVPSLKYKILVLFCVGVRQSLLRLQPCP